MDPVYKKERQFYMVWSSISLLQSTPKYAIRYLELFLFLYTETFLFVFLLNSSYQIHHLCFNQVLWVLRFIQFGGRGSLRERMQTSDYKLGKYSEWEKQWQHVTNVEKLTNITNTTKEKQHIIFYYFAQCTFRYFLLFLSVYFWIT